MDDKFIASHSYNHESLQRHSVTVEEINEVLRSPLTIVIDLEPSRKGNDRVIWIGFTFNIRLLEIGIEYLPNNKEHVFHAMDATKTHRKEFEKKIGPL